MSSEKILIRGRVVHGDGRGRELGFPTVNLSVSDFSVPSGVYISHLRLEDGRVFKAVTNIGTCPTFSDTAELVAETHLLDVSLDLYGEWIEVECLQKLRDEKAFSSPEQLLDQIRKDLAKTRNFFHTKK